MSRLQVALNVSNIDLAVDFYRRLFNTEPAKRRPGYANVAIADPPMKLVLIEGVGEPGTLNHIGVEVTSSGEVATEAMLAHARAKAERTGTRNWELRIGDAYALDHPAASFDVVVNCFMFDLLPEADFGRVLGEFHRVLRPSGRLVLANLARTGWPVAPLSRQLRVAGPGAAR